MKRSILLVFTLFVVANLSAQTPITPCAQFSDIHVVVLGSSTAAGTGPSSIDSAWVNRYTVYLQGLNPQNQVTNLGVGGTTTYHIMPDWFVPPAGRPLPTPNNNVTQAVSLGADAIIVNMPSNDAANNFATSEQLFNFATIVAVADSAGIPVWVCTTQPRNNFSAAQILVQTQVRDSVLAIYGPMALDFWSGAATVGNTINPIYDSGDGVHLNNAGHGILNNVVIQAGIPNVIADTMGVSEFTLASTYLENYSACGDSNTVVKAVIANLGISSLAASSINFEVTDNAATTTTTTTGMATLSPIGTCGVDTLTLPINTYSGVNLSVLTYLTTTDLDPTNDTAQVLDIQTSGHPLLTSQTDSVCVGDSAVLMVNGNLLTDNIVWYDSLAGGNILGVGNSLVVNSPFQTYFPEAVRGNLWFDNSLFTLSNTNVNWNGVTFDIVATDTITIDSLLIKVNSTGNQTVVAYNRMGSQAGQAMNAAAWTTWGTVNLQVGSAGDFKVLDLSDVVLPAGDTLGVYLHMQTSGSNLSYRNTGSTASYQNSEIQILSGSGVSFTFGSLFTPRVWSGEVYYHHGFNPTGDCNSTRQSVTPVVFDPTLDLGNDTAFCAGETIQLNGGNFASYLWSTQDVTAGLLVSNAGNYHLLVTDSNGCQASDSIEISAYDLPQFTLGGDTAFCSGESIVLNPGSFESYLWNTAATIATLTITTGGTYNVEVTDSNNCQNADTIEVTEWTVPAVDLGNDTVLCEGDSLLLSGGNFVSYLWSNAATTPSIYATAAGVYQLQVTDTNGCANADEINISLTICVGINESGSEPTIRAFPNPTTGEFFIDLPTSENLVALRVTDLHGRLVYSNSAANNQQRFSLEVPPGLYFVEVQTERSTQLLRLVVSPR